MHGLKDRKARQPMAVDTGFLLLGYGCANSCDTCKIHWYGIASVQDFGKKPLMALGLLCNICLQVFKCVKAFLLPLAAC